MDRRRAEACRLSGEAVRLATLALAMLLLPSLRPASAGIIFPSGTGCCDTGGGCYYASRIPCFFLGGGGIAWTPGAVCRASTCLVCPELNLGSPTAESASGQIDSESDDRIEPSGTVSGVHSTSG